MKILFFSRGRGRGHAIPDVAIANELLRSDSTASIQFVSYGMGAKTIQQNGYEVIDLKLPEDNPFFDTQNKSIQVINDYEPSMIISHEEFCIPPIARLFGVPCVFLIDWFPPEGSLWMQALVYADSVIFMDAPGYYDEPSPLSGKIEYVGPVIRELTKTTKDRRTAREQLALPLDLPIVLILPGGSYGSSEERTPLFDLVTSAIQLLDRGAVGLWVVSEEEQNILRDRVPAHAKTVFMRPHVDIVETMIASDVVITKATRKTAFELNALAIPSISISYGLNPVDDYRVPQIKTNRALRVRGLTALSLSGHLSQVLAERVSESSILTDSAEGRLAVVAAIRRLLAHYTQVD